MMIQREQLKHLSSAIQITPGIPQGLIMGPILFLLDLEIGVPQGNVIGLKLFHLNCSKLLPKTPIPLILPQLP